MIALAEEERATCPSCGMLKVICRDPANQYGTFEPKEDTCWATYRLAQHTSSDKWKGRHDDTKRAVQVSVAFREGRAPALDVGLELESDGDEPADEG